MSESNNSHYKTTVQRLRPKWLSCSYPGPRRIPRRVGSAKVIKPRIPAYVTLLRYAFLLERLRQPPENITLEDWKACPLSDTVIPVADR